MAELEDVEMEGHLTCFGLVKCFCCLEEKFGKVVLCASYGHVDKLNKYVDCLHKLHQKIQLFTQEVDKLGSELEKKEIRILLDKVHHLKSIAKNIVDDTAVLTPKQHAQHMAQAGGKRRVSKKGSKKGSEKGSKKGSKK
jgi:hypothetical protein